MTFCNSNAERTAVSVAETPKKKPEKHSRQFSEVKGQVDTTGYLDREYNTLRKLSHTPAAFIKCPVNIGDSLKRRANSKAWMEFKLYVKYLDLKVQNPDCGTFQIFHSHRHYQRVVKALIEKGWATRTGKIIYLKAYQHVWRCMGIERIDRTLPRYKYWKIPISMFSNERRKRTIESVIVEDEVKEVPVIGGYLKEIEHELRTRISKRKLAQFRYALKEKDSTRATFSAKSAGSLFGYKSADSGSKLRKTHFKLVKQTPEEAKPRFNRARGRFEEPTKQIEL